VSSPSITPSSTAAESEQAVAARVRQIQSVIEQAREGALGASSQGASEAPSFAEALQSASSTPTASSAAYQGGEGAPYEAAISQAAQRYGIEPALLHGLIQQESGFDPSSQSSAGAMGLTQLMPGTASSLGVRNPFDPTESIEGGARYLAQLMSQFGGNTTDALAAYNAGPAAVSQHGGVPPYPETEAYVAKVLGYAEAFRREHPASAYPGGIT
jgi:soluble lytic murein transglycosylase-like protein